jgi:hypothetical protein
MDQKKGIELIWHFRKEKSIFSPPHKQENNGNLGLKNLDLRQTRRYEKQ